MKTFFQIASELKKTEKEVREKTKESPLCDILPPFIEIKNGVEYVSDIGENFIKTVFTDKRDEDGNLFVFDLSEFGNTLGKWGKK